ncbi:putative glutathione S-transferase parC [Silene latifolia]|uniref:putative glutathione S-transferase parC n=1 Tax=Silene latifolia TaxID=37657 RepID=UPI003D77197A
METTSDEIKILDFWISPFCMRVKIALEEKGITEYECLQEDPYVHKTVLLREMNPVHNRLPVLIHNGKPICESLIIVEYIDEVWKDNSSMLLPVDPFLKSRARFLAHFIDTKLMSVGMKLSRAKGEAEIAKKEFIECLKLLEAELGDKPYFGGNNFGYLDIALIPDYSWFYTYETCAQFSIQAECPELIAWANRCMQRPSVQRSLPNPVQVYNYVLERNRNLGLA